VTGKKALLIGPLPLDPATPQYPVALLDCAGPILNSSHCLRQSRNAEQTQTAGSPPNPLQVLMAVGKAGINDSSGQFDDALCPAQPGSGIGFLADKNKSAIPYREDIGGRSIGICCVDGRIAKHQI